VINQSIPVDEKARLRVVAAVEKLNYKPNLLAKGLRVRSGHLIGFINPEIRHHPFINIINHIVFILLIKVFKC
jgi:LacI family transcriptional regulator